MRLGRNSRFPRSARSEVHTHTRTLTLTLLHRTAISRRLLTDSLRRDALNQAHDQGNGFVQELLSTPNLFGCAPAFGDQHIQARRAFQGRPASVFKEPATIRCGVFTIALGQIERDGSPSPIKLITDRRFLSQALDKSAGPSDKLNAALIRQELLMVEVGWGGLHSARE